MFSIQHLPKIPLTTRVNVQLAWVLWCILFLIVVGLIVTGNGRTVTPSYAWGAQHWLEGKTLYSRSGEGFIYLPQSAIAFVPFHLMPHEVCEIAWRVLTVGLFLAGMWRLARLSQREHGIRLFPLMTLICLPLTFSSVRNGQATLSLAGLMMLAVVDQCDRRWWRATLWLSLGLVAKPLMVVPLLLAGALYPALRLRLALGMVVIFGFPFLCQRPDYVLSTYVDCGTMLLDADHRGFEVYWAQLFGMLRVFGLEVPHTAQTLTRLLAAVATLGLCWLALKRHSPVQAHIQQFAMAATYLMLMNPRTENNTYSLLAPALALFCGQALLVNRRYIPGGLLLACAVIILCSNEVGRLFVPPPQAIFLAPMGCLVFAVVLVRAVLSRKNLATNLIDDEPEIDSAPPCARAA